MFGTCRCEAEGTLPVTDEGTCPRCGKPVEYVYSFQPRRYDPPQFVAADEEELDAAVEGQIGAGQCDGCGNSVYEVRRTRQGRYEAVCVLDAYLDESSMYDPCGAAYPIRLRPQNDVCF